MACLVEKTLPVAWMDEKLPRTIVPQPRHKHVTSCTERP